ncbi:hypothetical protein PUMCH_001295 [Australozyma saopauloensis]|uniref:Thioredoxin domain-containing protein n=1 Tax=Australozyma saopauloensis TaxID=291208 RepID=A0AAX4H638_9ASCO|nr:hypothetical protein PUMCH_001295 [[Candida] saopauloensis]
MLKYLLILPLCIASVLEVLSKEEILRKPISLVYFYAPDCRFCTDVTPAVDYLSSIYNHNVNFQIVKVNGRKLKPLVQLFEVASFPTLKIYDNDKKSVTTYSGDRLIDLIDDFIAKHSDAQADLTNAITRVHSLTSLEQLNDLAAAKGVVIAFMDSTTPEWKHMTRPFHYFQELAQQNPHLAFATAELNKVDSKVVREFRVSNSPSLVFYDGQTVGVLGTFSANEVVDDEQTIRFTNLLTSKSIGTWFSNLAELQTHADEAEYVDTILLKPGMNAMAHSAKDFEEDIEGQYEQLLGKISL